MNIPLIRLFVTIKLKTIIFIIFSSSKNSKTCILIFEMSPENSLLLNFNHTYFVIVQKYIIYGNINAII